MTDEEQAAVRQLDAMIAVQRVEGAPVVRASADELKWLLLITVGLMVPMAICYVSLSVESRRTVAAYIAIIGFVLAGWGLWRSWLAKRRKSVAAIAMLYFMVFLMNFAIYTTTLLSLTNAWDLFAKDAPTSLRKK
jgi:hypothetical protein